MAAVANSTWSESLQAQTAGVNPGTSTVAIPRIDPGELLLIELNCAACHSADARIKARSRTSPRLGETGMRITPQYLRAFLTNPQGEKPGTPMPDLLHGLSAPEKSETVDALVHFLVSQNPTNSPAPAGADVFKIQQGRLLYHQVGCVACHAPQETVTALQSKASPNPGNAPAGSTDPRELKNSSVPLGNLAKKTTVAELAKFLMDPLKARPAGRMPSLNLTENEATAIAMYLLRDQIARPDDPARPPQKIQGLSYQYYEARFDGVPAFDNLPVIDSGFVDNFTLAPRKRQGQIGFRFTGFVKVPADGNYTFYTESDDGSRLYIGDKLVVNNDGDHAPAERKGSIQLTAGDHPIMVGWFNSGGGSVLEVSYEGSGIPKQPIPNSALSRLGQPMIPLNEEKFVVDAAKASHGRQLFNSLGCASCHLRDGETMASPLNAKPLANVSPKKSDGCLGDQIKRDVPQFHLNAAQRAVLQNTLAHPQKLSEPLEPKQQALHTLAALNCFACHARDGIGGPAPERADYFTVVGNVDMGDEGRFPPNLTKAGNKLRPEWIQDVLVKKGAVRPYMATRMPQFGETNVGHLAAIFEQADASAPPIAPSEYSATQAKFGRKLVGTGGLSCVACHTFANFKSLGIPAIDLTQMANRLKKDWFNRYLLDPQSLRPGTRMPNFWPEGKSVNNDILGGDTQKQIDAIWSYLSKGREADVPEGMIRGKVEIVADKEPVIYRNFIAGAGSRAIGVGYPEKANLAFDANELRLALIWQGAFIDGARHRTGRGEGFEPPLGNNIVKMPPGPAFAMLTDTNAPWPQAIGKKAGYRMRGYRLDEKRRPTFLYSIETIYVEDSFVAVPGELDAGFSRTLTFQCDRPRTDLWFRAAVGSTIEATSDGWYFIDDKIKLKFTLDGNANPLIRKSGGQSELLVPVVFAGKDARIVEDINW